MDRLIYLDLWIAEKDGCLSREKGKWKSKESDMMMAPLLLVGVGRKKVANGYTNSMIENLKYSVY
jgi:hypothetical protein